MDLIQRTNLVNANTIRSKDLIHASGKETMRDPKVTTNVIDVVISYIFAKNFCAPKHLVALYQKSLKESKHGEGTKYETHFNLASVTV